jgi:hypothetical protein
MGWAFDRDVGPAGKLGTMNVCYHEAKMLKPASVGHNNVVPAKIRGQTTKRTRSWHYGPKYF